MGKQVHPDKRCDIPFGERDRSLLKDGLWPNMEGLDDQWTLGGDGNHVSRTLEFVESGTPARRSDGGGTARVSEAILRFPNAPVYLTHRARLHPYKIQERWPNYHDASTHQ